VSHYRISELASCFGLSRSTLLYYDRIGLLPPSGRTRSGYRCYTELDRKRLARIRTFRAAGFRVEDIRDLLQAKRDPSVRTIERRIEAIGEEILALRSQQHLLAGMLQRLGGKRGAPAIDKAMWVEMLRAAGLDEAGMRRWHAELEARAPLAHAELLRALGIGDAEAAGIRRWARHAADDRQADPRQGASPRRRRAR